MKKITAADPESRSADLLADNVDKLRELFPQAFTEGKVDFQVLRELLGDAVEEREERYGLNWHGKAKARRLALTPSTGTLRPVKEESVDWDTTQNLIIEGDNLEVLKLLQKSYAGKVKLIYIDPPYNTGGDFVYKDDFTDNLSSYLARTAQVDTDGNAFSSNPETSGRYHTDWLNMMHARLRLARSLLQDDGVIFISIDRHEHHHLRLLLDEVFGPENFIDIFTWVRTSTPAALAAKSKKVVEYVYCYERAKSPIRYKGIEKPVQSTNPLLNQPNSVSELIFPPGSILTKIPDGVLAAGTYGTDRYRVDLLADAQVKGGRFVSPVHMRAKFRWTQSYLEEQLASGVRVLIATRRLIPSYEKDSYGREAPPNLIDSKVGVGTNENASSELRSLLPGLSDAVIGKMHPKPVSLLKYLVDAVCDEEDVVLDFFAGSGTTGEAVLRLNASDGGRRRFILCQLPEPAETDGFPTIASITRARVMQAGRKVGADAEGKIDVGFRSFHLDSTNLRPWDPTPTDIQTQLGEHVDHIKPDRTEGDLLYEVLIKLGIDLSVPIETRTIAGFEVHNIGAGQLLACFGTPIRRDDATPLARGITAWHDESRPEAADAAASTATLLFRDAAFEDDVAKQNLVHALEQAGLTNIRSL